MIRQHIKDKTKPAKHLQVHIHAKLVDILYISYKVKWLRCQNGVTFGVAQVNTLNEI